MGLFGKLFSKRIDPEAERVRQIFERAEKDSTKPQGGPKMALLGAAMRNRLLGVIYEVEADIAQMAFAFTEDKGVLCVHPKLEERLRKEDNYELLEAALPLAFATPAATRRRNELWPVTVRKYCGLQNTVDLLSEKANLLAIHVVGSLDISATIYARINQNGPDLSDEQDISVRLEEAACWYRVIDEQAHRYICKERILFMDYFQDNLAHFLALGGAPPDAINRTLADRTKEYARYHIWISGENEGPADTVLWETAKHIGELFDGGNNHVFQTVGFNIMFARDFLDRLKQACVYELLTGRNDRPEPS